MNVKVKLCLVLSLLFISFLACKKNVGPSVLQVTEANIDSITGTYTGITSGDSIFSYVDSLTGITVQTLHSFSWLDTLHITSPDTNSFIVNSKYYSINYSYGDSLTAVDSVTTLQNETLGQNGYVEYNTILVDTANNVNHLVINTWYNYNKHVTTSVFLHNR